MTIAYEYEVGIIGMLGGVEDRHFIDLSDHKNELKDVYAKAKAFDEIVEVFKDYPLKTDSDVMDFIQAKLDDMEEK